jgi:hypothetical protein
MTNSAAVPTGSEPDTLVPDPAVAREFGVCLATLSRWDKDERMAEMGWEQPIRIRNRKYRGRKGLEKVKIAFRDFGLASFRLAPRSTGARRPAPARASEGA